MTVETYKRKIGLLIQETRQARGFTQGQLAKLIGTSQSAINRIEKGGQNVSLEMIARISEVLSANILTLNQTHKIDFRVHGGNKLSGSIDVKTSKNAAVCLLCAALLNHNTTILHNVPHIEEVNRIIEVLQSINVKVHWVNNDCDIEIDPPARLDLAHLNNKAASRTRSILLLLGALIHQYPSFKLPFSGGCKLGKRTVEPHLAGLAPFGLNIVASNNYYNVTVEEKTVSKPIILVERSDTATENVLMAAALYNGEVTIRNASPNYMVQDLCFFLEKLGVKIAGVGTTTLVINGLSQINKKVDYYLSEDPIEAMSFIAAAVVTDSEITIRRAPIEFLEIELAVLKNMGLSYSMTDEYKAKNGKTRLVDLTIHHSKMIASKDKLHSMPFPGVNMDNLPLMGSNCYGSQRTNPST